MLRAFDGDSEPPVGDRDAADAGAIVLARREDRIGLLDAAATMAATRPGMTAGRPTPIEGNGWDALVMEPGAWFDLPVPAAGPAALEIRVLAAPSGSWPGGGRIVVRVIDAAGAVRSSASVDVTPPGADAWEVLHVPVATSTGDRIRIEAVEAGTIQSVRGFMPAGPIAVGASPVPGWQIATVAPDAIVLEPNP